MAKPSKPKSKNLKSTKLTAKQEHFARLLGCPDERGKWRTAAEAYRLSYNSKGGSLETSRRSATELMAEYPHVAERVNQLRAQSIEELEHQSQVGIAIKATRILNKQERYDKLMALIEARAESATGQCPGEETGLLAHDQKSVGSGPLAEIVDVWKVDKSVLDALNDLENDVAKELGQIINKSDMTSDGEPIAATPAVVLYLPQNGR